VGAGDRAADDGRTSAPGAPVPAAAPLAPLDAAGAGAAPAGGFGMVDEPITMTPPSNADRPGAEPPALELSCCADPDGVGPPAEEAEDPAEAEPGAAGLGEPGAADPGVVEPGVVEPGVVVPGAVEPGVEPEGVPAAGSAAMAFPATEVRVRALSDCSSVSMKARVGPAVMQVEHWSFKLAANAWVELVM
jgi:hypothetical protein